RDDRASLMQHLGAAGDDALASRTQMRGIEVDADDGLPTGEQIRVHRGQGLGEDDVSTAVEEAHRLRIACDRDGADEMIMTELDEFDPHLLCQGAAGLR